MEQNTFNPLDLGGLQPFALGGTGACYRLSEDTILKLYYEGFPVECILREKEGARAALVAGVPTAISFDLVQVGNRRGVMYEMVQGKNVSECVVAEPSRAVEMGGALARIADTLHRAEVKKNDLPLATESIRAAVRAVDYLPERSVDNIMGFLDQLDRERHYVHGDFHPNNVIVTRSEPMLIDMGGFSLGSAMFDIATLHFCLFDSPDALRDGRSTFNGMSHEEAQNLWQGFEREYFGADGEDPHPMDAQTEDLLYRILVLVKLRFEQFFRAYIPGEYCDSVRREVLEVFGGVRQ